MTDDAGQQWSGVPGWHFTPRALLPFQLQRRLRRTGEDPLIELRNTYVSFPLSLVVFGLVLPLILPFRGAHSGIVWLIASGVLAVANLTVLTRFERSLPCDSEAALAAAYRSRFFLRIAFADTTAVVGFVGAFSGTGSWVYYAAVLMALPALLRAAPTRSALVRDQDELTARGCNLSLVAAIRRTPPK